MEAPAARRPGHPAGLRGGGSFESSGMLPSGRQATGLPRYTCLVTRFPLASMTAMITTPLWGRVVIVPAA